MPAVSDQQWPGPEPETLGMAAVAGGVAAGAALAPATFLRLFGIGPEQLTPAAVLGLRLFAIRNLAVALPAARGNPTARDLFLPVQLLDQLAWWELFRAGRLSLRATAMAASASAAIIGLDLKRRARR